MGLRLTAPLFQIIDNEMEGYCIHVDVSNHRLFCVRDWELGSSLGDRVEARETARQLADEKRERNKRDAERRAFEMQQNEELITKLRESKELAGIAIAEIFGCQQGLFSLLNEIDHPKDAEAQVLDAKVIAQWAKESGKVALETAAEKLGAVQAEAEQRLKEAVDYVCKNDFTIRDAIDAVNRENLTQENYDRRIQEIAGQGIIDINLGLLQGANGTRVVTIGEMGLKPEVTYGDLAAKITETVFGPIVAPFSVPYKMIVEYGCYKRALQRIEEQAELLQQEQIRKEAEKLRNDIESSFESSKDHQWNRDPGMIDFIGRHGNIS